MSNDVNRENARSTLEGYGFKKCAEFFLREDDFVIEGLTPECGEIEKVLYVFVIDDKIVRIGSSKAKLASRMVSWSRDVSKAFRGQFKPTPEDEARKWRTLLGQHGRGTIYARQGHQVTTPIGTFPAYLDEESLLIGKFRPPLNRNMHR